MTTPYQIELLQHTLGLRVDRRESFRNHFVAGDGHTDMPHLEALERAGLMERRRSPRFLADGDIVFAATDAGHQAALAALPEPAKRTRYEDYLDADGCAGNSFGEFLCGLRLPEYETRRDLRRDERYGVVTITEYRMFRRYDYWTRDVQGGWCRTKKEAKASYKEELAAFRKRAKATGEKA
ncbi:MULTISPECIES: hypothetical protein [unclassified Caballeronia]|uniref:hypothetical protein n=1 Tax=unclassified Caballeronia TaxID=2646786 RepID=UPI0020297B55|nr:MULTISPECIES: hypothetical protein [unclassified Caballeronia]